jgi:hypothetical protein
MFAFLTQNLIVAGAEKSVKEVIDLVSASGESVLDNPKMKHYVDKINSNAVLSIAGTVSEQAVKTNKDSKHKIDLSEVEAVVGNLDRGVKNWHGEIELISNNESKNQQLVYALKALKYFLGAANPELSDIINNINITTSAENVHIAATFPDDLFEKIKNRQININDSLNKENRHSGDNKTQ